MTTRSDVLYAYRLLLGREPESDAVVDGHVAASADLEALRQRFVQSAEFSARVGPAPPRPRRDSPAMIVEVDAPAAKLAALFAQTSAQWHHLGATEPHWSVLTSSQFRQDQLAANRESFYASGESDVMAFAAALQRVGLTVDQGGRLLELGCGVGRVTSHLARHAGEVLAVDISAAHLRLAEQHVRATGADNVEFRQLRAIDDVARLGPFDGLFSLIVLQHNPPPVMARLLRDLLLLLRPGGVAFFQLPTYQLGYRFVIDEYLAQGNTTRMEVHCLPQAALFELLRAHDCQLLELREDDSVGRPGVTISNTLLVQKRAR